MIRRLTDAGAERERPAGPDGVDAAGNSEVGNSVVGTGLQPAESVTGGGTALLEPDAGEAGEADFSEGGAFQPHLDSFAGPLDLLLYLIHKNEIDIFDIPIRLILDQYLHHLEALQSSGNLDLANAGEFLVMASRLMEIKSRLLLPSHSELDDDEPLEEEIDDPRRSLVEQLLEYREIKEKAMLLQDAHFQRQQRFERLQHLMIEDPEAKLDVGDSTVLDLCAAFQRVLEDLTTRRGEVRVIEMEDIPLEDVIHRISTRLYALAGEPLSFRSLFEPGMSVTILISHFLAVLEMARLRVIRLRQESEDDLHLVLRETQTPMISDVFAGAAAETAPSPEVVPNVAGAESHFESDDRHVDGDDVAVHGVDDGRDEDRDVVGDAPREQE